MDDADTALGGLDFSLKFAEPEDREEVIHKARGVGWSPPHGSEEEEWDTNEEDNQSSAARGVALRFKIDKVWFPLSVAQRLGSGDKLGKGLLAYARYKFYDKSRFSSLLFQS